MEQIEGSPFTMPIPNTLEIYWITRTLREQARQIRSYRTAWRALCKTSTQ
jgi:hypothetical protein